MKTLATEITINASPQTVWSILDDLERYPEWNALVPELRGRTTVGETVEGKLVQPNTPVIPLAPTLTRIVGARELRWITIVPGDQGFTAEHYFILTPTEDGGTHLVHNEDFDGPAVEFLWEGVNTNGRQAYNQMNADLKARAEALESASVVLHPAVDGPPDQKSVNALSTVRCRCACDKVEVTLTAPAVHNHLCGCTKCWKPEGALFALTAVVPVGTLEVTANSEKLDVIDPGQSIQRHACKDCGTHMFGHVPDKDHHFYGMEFIHPELSNGASPAGPPEFAGFVSSIIEAGASPSQMEAVRHRLSELCIPAYDAFSPEIMDIIAWHKVKLGRGPHERARQSQLGSSSVQ